MPNSDAQRQELSNRIASSAGKAASYLGLAEGHLQDVIDTVAALPTAEEQYEGGASRYVRELVDRVRHGRIQVIEIGEQLVAKHHRWT